MKPTNKKKQHYVPQFVQKRFSNDGKRVNVWDIRNKHFYDNIPIRGQLQEKYFYERTEDGFEQTLERLENMAKSLFDQIENIKDIPERNSDDWTFLVLWTVVQVQRTDVLANPINNYYQELVRTIAQILEAKGGMPDGPDGLGVADLDIKVDAQWGRQNAVALAFETAYAAGDLDARILHSPDGRIILPDCGAFRFNLIAEEGRLPWGWASSGTGAILPLSNNNAVVFFDSASYTWMDNSKEVTKVMDEHEHNSLIETILLRSSNRVILNTDPDWLIQVDADLHDKCSQFGAPKTSIPGLIPHPMLMEQAREAENRLYGLPPRPSVKSS